MRKGIIILTLFVAIIILIPAVIVLPFSHAKDMKADQMPNKSKQNVEKQKSKVKTPNITVSVYRENLKKTQKVPFNDYLVGVVGSEMPAKFDLEALKAQTLAARTYIISHLLGLGSTSLPDGGQVTDTTQNQVYKNDQELRKIWGKDYSWKIKKIRQAVLETADQIIMYKGEPISTPSFFSTSNGYTEDAKDYWSSNIPYLQSVSSPWDKASPKYKVTEKQSVSTVEQKLNITLPSADGPIGKVTKRTEGKRIATFKIGNKTFTGREIREALNLRSTDFSMTKKGNQVSIKTIGYGHGVGMSQYGAEGMAKEGANYKQILSHYYKGTSIQNMEPFTKRLEDK
ncbi:stage II sporulation protein D [Terrilactibacillus sp. BCM23-1]|uniref:Stage II sporulation protein D n=1 Tax=Terrilactibacillus tamarindi TaxID=2599694 RepID=A0A6N8CMZ5_9BACI|nr:stage II sporulation protein D [Terrilactibacillus tamarindi]MTT31008.1 stage II sporulation protein D [Terrilactibacillus tamarindi]